MPATATLYAILDTMYVPTDDAWEGMARALAESGVDMVEVRAKGASTGELIELAERGDAFFREAGIPVVINDDLEAALAKPGWGLHIGQDDGDPVVFRKQLGPSRILGLSTHSKAQAAAALALPPGTLSYFAVGPVYATGTKPDYQPVGTDLIRAVRAMEPPLPFFAIGGVNRRTLPEVLEAGASRVVVVSDILLAEEPGEVIRQLRTAGLPKPG